MTAIERGDVLRATITDREYRVGRVDAGAGSATVFAPRAGNCRTFSVALDELREDVAAGRIVVVDH